MSTLSHHAHTVFATAPSTSRTISSATFSILFAASILSSPVFAAGTLNAIAEQGEFRLGYRDAMAPFSSATASGRAKGYSVDVCLEIYHNVQRTLKQKIKLTFVPVQSRNRLDMLERGKIHVECGITTNTIERQKRIAFSHHFFVAGTALLVRKGSPIKDTTDLEGRKLGHIKNTTSVSLIQNSPELRGDRVTLIPFERYDDAFKALRDGKIDAFYGDDTTQWAQIIRSTEPQDYAILPKRYSIEPYSIGLKKDRGFKTLVDQTTRQLFESGKIRTLYDKWFVTARKYPLEQSSYFHEIIRRPSDVGIHSISF